MTSVWFWPAAVSGPTRTPTARTEVVLALLRAAGAFITVTGLLAISGASLAPHSAMPARATVGWSLAILATALAVFAGVVLGRHSDVTLRRLGLALTIADLATYVVYTSAFHGVAGAGTFLGLFVLVEGPIRFGALGAVGVGAPLAIAAIRWPQVDVSGRPPSAAETVILVVLIAGVTAVTRLVWRHGAQGGRALQEQWAVAFAHCPSGMALLDAGGRLLDANAAFARIVGRAPEELAGVALSALVDGDNLTLGGSLRREAVVERPGGDPTWVLLVLTALSPGRGPSTAARFVVQLEDITERKGFESQLSHQATHDPLTGLGNRLLFMQIVDAAISRREPVALLYVDLDRFKQVNDVLGHGAGDELLREVVRRITHVVRPGDVVCRVGGDEFAVLCFDAWDTADAVRVGERIVTALDAPVRLPGGDMLVSASVGVALPGDAKGSGESVVADADTAMYRAKQAGGARVHVFTAPMRAAIRRRHDVETNLRAAMDDGQLRLFYQPLVDLRTGSFCGVEALLRRRAPGGEFLPPGDAIEVAEESDLIVDLGAWVIREALGQLASWPEPAADGEMVVGLNVSTRELTRPGFAQAVGDLLAAYHVPAGRVCLEVTETALAGDVDLVVSALHDLRTFGVRLAIDDFGTGHASLTYLARFPVDYVKVDRSFITGLGVDPTCEVIVASVVAMAHALGMRVVAEGVETLAQLESVLAAGCDIAQGYLFARPAPAAQAAIQLANAVPWPVTLADRRSTADVTVVRPSVQMARRYRLLLDLARDVTVRLDLEEVLARTFAALRQLLDFSGGSIQLVDGQEVGIVAAVPAPTAEALAARIPLGAGVGGRIALTGEPRYIPDILDDPVVSPARRKQSASTGVRSYFGVPLILEGHVFGLIQVDSTQVDAFTEEDRFMVLAFTPIVAAALQNARTFERDSAALLVGGPRHPAPSAASGASAPSGASGSAGASGPSVPLPRPREG